MEGKEKIKELKEEIEEKRAEIEALEKKRKDIKENPERFAEAFDEWLNSKFSFEEIGAPFNHYSPSEALKKIDYEGYRGEFKYYLDDELDNTEEELKEKKEILEWLEEQITRLEERGDKEA